MRLTLSHTPNQVEGPKIAGSRGGSRMQIFLVLFSIIPHLQANDWGLLEGWSRDGLGWRADL